MHMQSYLQFADMFLDALCVPLRFACSGLVLLLCFYTHDVNAEHPQLEEESVSYQ